MTQDPQHVVRGVDEERWRAAQAFELSFAEHGIDTGSDFNEWWQGHFDGYKVLAGRRLDNVLEVGCGPHTNIRLMLPLIQFKKIYLEDPLIGFYVTRHLGKRDTLWKKLKRLLRGRRRQVNALVSLFADPALSVDLSSEKLEKLPYPDGVMDLVVCINVLDHVTGFDACLSEMHRVLKKDGLLVLGQDLSNEDDLKNCPASYEDVGHPIKVDEAAIQSAVNGKYADVFKKVLSRSEGRNPAAHYGTYLGVLRKL